MVDTVEACHKLAPPIAVVFSIINQSNWSWSHVLKSDFHLYAMDLRDVSTPSIFFLSHKLLRLYFAIIARSRRSVTSTFYSLPFLYRIWRVILLNSIYIRHYERTDAIPQKVDRWYMTVRALKWLILNEKKTFSKNVSKCFVFIFTRNNVQTTFNKTVKPCSRLSTAGG